MPLIPESLLPHKQFRKPSGLFALLMPGIFDRRNASQNDWAIKFAEFKPSDKVLEIGFGSGRAIKIISKLVSPGFVAGIDFSKAMVKAASRRNRKAIKAGSVEIKMGEAESLPYADNFFDKVLAVYVLYFFPEPRKILKEIWRVLKPGGNVVLLVSAKTAASGNAMLRRKDFKMYSEQELKNIFTESGFTNLVFNKKVFEGEEKICVIATK